MPKLLLPEAARDLLVRRFNHQHRNWLEGGGAWPLTQTLGVPTEQDMVKDAAGIRAWVGAWAGWSGPGTVEWQERKWPRMGLQRLPASLVMASPQAVASVVGQTRRWTNASGRFAVLVAKWPALARTAGLARHFDVLADYPDADFQRLVDLVSWLQDHPASGHYLRQLPVRGLDTKWLERRTALVADLLRLVRELPAVSDFHAFCGLRKPSQRLRMRLLCPRLRARVGGLGDIEAPLEELGALDIAPRRALVVENLETGIALPDFEGTVAFMKLGHAVGVLAAVRWLRHCRTLLYWGDLDTHGLAILNQARGALPGLRSVLMNERTLLDHRPLWGQEPSQHPGGPLSNLDMHERQVFDGLKSDRWGPRLRLEQERLPWTHAIAALTEALA